VDAYTHRLFFPPPSLPRTGLIYAQRVAQAAASVLGTAGAITHETLFIGVHLFSFAPVPGLAAAAQTLLKIWDAVQLVDVCTITPIPKDSFNLFVCL